MKNLLGLVGLVSVEKNMHDGYDYTLKTGNKIMLIPPYSYELLIVRDKNTARLASLYILIGIIGSVSGVFAYDRQNNMKNTLRCSYRGRRRLNAAKMISVLTICTLVCISVHLIQFVQIGMMAGYNDMSAPVQSLPFMREFVPYISISEYFILLFILRSASACLMGLICSAVSHCCSDTYTSMGVSVFILAVPSVFAELIPSVNMINAVYLISGEFFN